MRCRRLSWLFVSLGVLAVFCRLSQLQPANRFRNRLLANSDGISTPFNQRTNTESAWTSGELEELTKQPDPSNGTAGSNQVARFPYRLSNTSKTLAQLTRCQTAILLENALLDTSQPMDLPIPETLRAGTNPGSYIVQSRGPPDDAFRTLIAAAGATFVAYIPNNAYLVQASASSAKMFSNATNVRAILPFEPYYKLKSPLLKLAVDQGSPRGLVNSSGLSLPLRILSFPGAETQTRSALETLGIKFNGEDTSPFGTVLFAKVSLANLASVAGLSGVQELEMSSSRVAANDLSRAAIGVSADSHTLSNYLGLTGMNVLVNINDTGVDVGHPDLVGRVYLDLPNSGSDSNGHGTHVAGIIAGNGSQSTSVTNAPGSLVPSQPYQFRGKAPAAKLFSIRVDSSIGSAETDSYLQQTAARTNALISNNSWNYQADNRYDLAAASFDAAVRDALPTASGPQPVLFVFAAGNAGGGSNDGTGGTPDAIQSPARKMYLPWALSRSCGS